MNLYKNILTLCLVAFAMLATAQEDLYKEKIHIKENELREHKISKLINNKSSKYLKLYHL